MAGAGTVVAVPDPGGGLGDGLLGAADGLGVDGDRLAGRGLQVMDVGSTDVESLAAAGICVDLQLQRVVGDLAGRRGLVVDDGQCGRPSALVVEDHICTAGDGQAVEVKLERPLGLPDPM